MGKYPADRKFCTYDEDGKRVNHKETVLALLQQCEDRGLTVAQSEFVLKAAITYIKSNINQSSLSAVLISPSDF